MVVSFSWPSFSSRVIGGFLSGIEDEGVVVEQGQRVGGELIQFWIAESERRLRFTWRLHLAQEMGDVIGAEGTGGESFLEGLSDFAGAVSAEQVKEFGKLADERTVGVGQTAQISFQGFLRAESVQQPEQPLLRVRTTGGRALGEQLFFKALGAEGLAAPE
jgi:hypothetical protein